MVTPRKVVVDDNDSSIFYSNNWMQVQAGDYDRQGNFGPTLKGTLHETTSSATLQYKFEGSEMTVYGSTNTSNRNGKMDPNWSCLIDDKHFSITQPFQFVENNWVMCSVSNLTDGPHVLTVDVNSGGQPFLFDYLIYTPTNQDSALQNALVNVAPDDPSIVYEGDWEPLGHVATMTSTRGSSLTFDFTGTSVAWYGIFPSELPIFSSQANYSIDGGPSQPFKLQGLLTGEVTQYNIKLFEVDTLQSGPHKLKVSFLSDNTSTPLALLEFLVQNGTSQIASGTSTGAVSPSSSTPVGVSSTSSNSVNVAGVVCGILGVFLLLLLLGFIYLRYRRRRQQDPLKPATKGRSFVTNFSRPFTRKQIPRMQQVSSLDLLEQGPEELQTPSSSPYYPPKDRPAVLPVTQEALLSRSQDVSPLRNFENVENWIQQQSGGSRPRVDKQKARQTSPPSVSPRQHRVDKKKARQTSPPPSSPSLVPADQLNENTPYYGGFQTWGQIKALEAQVNNKQRDSYM